MEFNFINRLKEKYQTIKNILSDESKFIEATGLHSRKNKLEFPKNTSLIDNITTFIKTDAVKSFYIEYDKTHVLEKDKIDIIKDVRIYHQPMLLIREGIGMENLTAKCAISRKNLSPVENKAITPPFGFKIAASPAETSFGLS